LKQRIQELESQVSLLSAENEILRYQSQVQNQVETGVKSQVEPLEQVPKNVTTVSEQQFLHLNTANSSDTIPLMKFDLSMRQSLKRPIWLRRVQSEMYIKIPKEKYSDEESIVRDGDSWIEQAIQKTKLKIQLPKKKFYGDLEETAPMIRGDDWIPQVPPPVPSKDEESPFESPIAASVPIPTEKALPSPVEIVSEAKNETVPSTPAAKNAGKKRNLQIRIPTEKYREEITDTRTANVDIGDSWIPLAAMGQSDATLALGQVQATKKVKWYKKLFTRKNRDRINL
jgi:hypothetical protein